MARSRTSGSVHRAAAAALTLGVGLFSRGCGSDTDTNTDAGPPVAICRRPCAQPSDCRGLVNQESLDAAENWSCVEGACEYRGCLSDAQCSAAFGTKFVCRTMADVPQPMCVTTCTSVEQCGGDLASGGAYATPDRYRCEGGLCVPIECTCPEALYYPNAFCVLLSHKQPACGRSCSEPIDCSTGMDVTGRKNYACESGKCRYLGCSGDLECKSNGMGDSCRP
jgi:hypothetical protein